MLSKAAGVLEQLVNLRVFNSTWKVDRLLQPVDTRQRAAGFQQFSVPSHHQPRLWHLLEGLLEGQQYKVIGFDVSEPPHGQHSGAVVCCQIEEAVPWAVGIVDQFLRRTPQFAKGRQHAAGDSQHGGGRAKHG